MWLFLHTFPKNYWSIINKVLVIFYRSSFPTNHNFPLGMGFTSDENLDSWEKSWIKIWKFKRMFSTHFLTWSFQSYPVLLLQRGLLQRKTFLFRVGCRILGCNPWYGEVVGWITLGKYIFWLQSLQGSVVARFYKNSTRFY